MKDGLQYKGYMATVHFSVEDKVLYGKIEGIEDLVTFESDDLAEIETEFHHAVDDYLAYCEEVGKEPEKTYKGTFNVRISPALHRAAVMTAREQGISLNQVVEQAILHYVQSD